MDKKNTMLLTVIAVATLLVAVVGATFAYFTALGSDTSSSTAANVTTQKVQAIGLAGGKTLILPLTALQMDKSSQGKYYAIDTTATPTQTVEKNTERTHIIGTVTLPAGSTVGTKYKCTVTLNTSAAGVPSDIKAADGAIVFTSSNSTISKSYSLADLQDGSTKSDSLTFEYTATGAVQSDTVSASVYIENTNAEQNYLQGIDGTTGNSLIVTTGFASDFNCNVVAGS